MIREVFWIWGLGIGSIGGGLNFMEGAGRVHRFVGILFFEGEYCVDGDRVCVTVQLQTAGS